MRSAPSSWRPFWRCRDHRRSRRRSRCSSDPDDVSNPDAAFARKQGAGKQRHEPPPKTGRSTGPATATTSAAVEVPRLASGPAAVPEGLEVEGQRADRVPADRRRRPALLHRQRRPLRRARRAKTGKVIWKKQLASLNASSPAYSRASSTASASPRARRSRFGPATARSSGASRSTAAPSPRRSSSAGGCTSATRTGQLYALDIKDGSTVWETGLGGIGQGRARVRPTATSTSATTAAT